MSCNIYQFLWQLVHICIFINQSTDSTIAAELISRKTIPMEKVHTTTKLLRCKTHTHICVYVFMSECSLISYTWAHDSDYLTFFHSFLWINLNVCQNRAANKTKCASTDKAMNKTKQARTDRTMNKTKCAITDRVVNKTKHASTVRAMNKTKQTSTVRAMNKTKCVSTDRVMYKTKYWQSCKQSKTC